MTKKLKITIAICVAVVLVAALTIGLGVGLTVNRGDEHTHTWAAEWMSDKDGHWHECTGENCDETNGYAAHSDGNSDGKCDVCGYTMSAETPDLDPDTEDPIAVEGITLDKTTATVKEGANVTLTATVTPENATDKTVTWSTSNETIATVSDGVVTGVKAGEVTITAKAGDKSATCTVTVTAKQGTEDPEDPIAVEGITLDKTTATVKEGANVTLTATVTPENATDKTVTWSTSNETIATVSDGVVTGVKAGEVTITAKAGDKSATCTVTVTAATTEPEVVPVTGVTLSQTAVTLDIDQSITLTATVAPENATNKAVTWASDKTDIATVDANGKVTAVAAGTANITVTTADGGKTATCTVTVNPAADPDPDPPVHEHTWSTEWTTDADSHWHKCTGEGCDEVKDKAAHSDGNSDGKCDTCGYTMTTETPDPDPGQEATSQEYPFDYAELNQKAPDNKDGDHKTTTEITVGKYTLEAGIYHDGSTYINSQGKSIKVVLGGDYNSISLSAVSASSNKEVAITILNAEGVAVFERTVLSKTQQTISADNLPAGTYTIQTENSARIYNLKATEYYLPCACENLTQVAEYKAPTCTEAGNIAYWRCDDCGKLYSDAEGKTEITEADIAIPAKGHSPASGWSHDDASHWHACLNGCGTQLDKAAHDKNGADGACSVCGYKEGHIHSLTRQQYTDGCANNPVTYYSCSGCSNLFLDENGTQVVTMDDIQKKSAHDLAHHTAVEATCEHAGNIEYWECDSCHKFFTDEGITEVEQSVIVEAQLDHEYEYQSNSTQHWKECTMCKTELDGSRENHSFGAADGQGNQTCSDCGYKINTGALENVEEYGAYEESMYVVMQDDVTADLKVTYNAAGSNSVTAVPSELIRTVNGATRVDIVGVSAGTYDINLSIGGTNFTLGDIEVEAYDRSGYAHFDPDAPNDMYANGIGAYENDGTLKDGALVIYLTEENKNDISNSAYVYDEETDSYTKADITKYFHPKGEQYTSTQTNTTYTTSYSIGYFLNNRMYNTSTTGNPGTANGGINTYGIKAACDDYGAVVVRVMGKVNAEISGSMDSAIDGLTAYNSTDNAGTGAPGEKGDNGRMVRIVDAYNLTIEGIGEDASIYGWGFHFIANKGEQSEYGVHGGESFEVRNLTFERYPEDALGMEGQGDDITVPVQRCWVHNNVFKPGYASNPTEGDKAEGDGSCDFKRGYYYTFSYNYLEGCHKTNLIGASDSCKQYNITFHHNWWRNCGSRIPLTRQANVHYYNNYISVDADYEGEISYVMSPRASCYIFAEGNYFDGCKNIISGSGGTVKFWNNTFYACYDDIPSQTSSRDEKVSSNCEYAGTSYSSFELNSELFYDAEGKLATDSVTARKVVMQQAGVHGFGQETATGMNAVNPQQSVSIPQEGLTVDLSQVSKTSSVQYVNGVAFTNITGVSSGTVKGKGQLVTFAVQGGAVVTITCSGSGAAAGELIGADGKLYAGKINGTVTVELESGIYVLASGIKDKELTISAISFEDAAGSSEIRVQAVIDAINAIPSTVTLDSAETVNAARQAYDALRDDEVSQIPSNLVTKLKEAETTLSGLLVNNVINLIAQIGEVNENSYNAINAARTAYNALTVALRPQVTNYNVLVSAETEFENFEVISVQNMIDALPETSNVTIADESSVQTVLERYRTAYDAYGILDENQTAQVGDSRYDKVIKGMAYLEGVLNVYDFKDALAAVDVDSADMAALGAIIEAYNEFADDDTLVNLLTEEENIKYQSISEKYTEFASQAITVSFTESAENWIGDNSLFSYVTESSLRKESSPLNFGGVEYTHTLKMETDVSINFTTSATMSLTVYFSTRSVDRSVYIDGNAYNVQADGTVVINNLGAGTHSITKDDTNVDVFLISLTPAG